MGNSVDLFGLQRCARPGLEALADLAAYGTGTRTPCELVVNWSCHEQLAVSHDAASRAFEGLGNLETRGEVTGQYIIYTPKVRIMSLLSLRLVYLLPTCAAWNWRNGRHQGLLPDPPPLSPVRLNACATTVRTNTPIRLQAVVFRCLLR